MKMENGNQNLYLSTYKDEVATIQDVADAMKDIMTAFPTLTQGFYKMLTKRIISKEMSKKMLADSVNNVIDTCKYPQPTIAEFISWDNIVKIYKHSQILEMYTDNKNIWENIQKIIINGQMYFYNETEKFNTK